MQQYEFSAEDNPGRQRIVAAARRHFFAYGFRAVTMDDLARELGISKKTLYVHFPSKIALVQAVLLNKIRSVEADLKQIMSESSSEFIPALHKLLPLLQKHLEEVQPPFLRDLRRDAPETFKVIEIRRRDVVHQYFGKLVHDGQAAGVFRQDIPVILIVEILMAATEAIMNPEKLTDLNMSPKAGFSGIITVILEGIITETGRAIL